MVLELTQVRWSSFPQARSSALALVGTTPDMRATLGLQVKGRYCLMWLSCRGKPYQPAPWTNTWHRYCEAGLEITRILIRTAVACADSSTLP